MGKLIFIAGQLNVEIHTQETGIHSGSKKIVAEPRITLGGRAYRQAMYSKDLGMNVILLGSIGDDYYGKLIRESLEKAGISTSYIKDFHDKNTGMSIEICSENRQIRRYFSPGANLNDGEFQVPIDYYLHLCDAVIVNKWCNFNLRQQILQAAHNNSIPNIYVRSGFPDEEEQNLPIEYLLLDFSDKESDAVIESLKMKSCPVQKGIFIRMKGEIIVLAPTGEEFCRVDAAPESNTDWIVSRIMAKLDPKIKLNETISFESLFAC
jgi:hypothetical protein